MAYHKGFVSLPSLEPELEVWWHGGMTHEKRTYGEKGGLLPPRESKGDYLSPHAPGHVAMPTPDKELLWQRRKRQDAAARKQRRDAAMARAMGQKGARR